MRIISGRLGGRNFAAPKNQRTHPMGDRVRGGLFNTLGDITDLHVLDAFAGSGALGFEALSRGAATAQLIENDHAAQAAIADSILALQLSTKTKLAKTTADAWLTTTEDSFDLVFLDPPYDALQPTLVARLAARTKPNGIVVLSLPPNAALTLPETDFQQLSVKDYGDAMLHFYRRLGH